MRYYLSIDGGGTKTKILLTDENGIKLSENLQSTCHYLQCGLDGLTNIIKSGLLECLSTANLAYSDITYAFIAAAGYHDIDEDDPLIESAIEKAMNSIPFSVGNDMENAFAGALAMNCGINIVAGTGSIAYGKDSFGNTYRCGGWHHIFGGDEGSAYWFGCQLIREFTRQYDGRDTKTALYYHLKDTYGLTTASDILNLTVIDWDFDRSKVASLSTSVYELAKLGDPHALTFYCMAAKELSDMILATRNSLNFTTTVNVSYTGGVFKSGMYLLDPLSKCLENSNFILCPPILQPDCGGILLAMQYSGQNITPNIIANLKAQA